MISDFELLKLAILELVADAKGWNQKQLDKLEREQMERVWKSFQEVYMIPQGVSKHDYVAEHAKELYRKWEEKTFQVGPHLAMAQYVNTRAKDAIS